MTIFYSLLLSNIVSLLVVGGGVELIRCRDNITKVAVTTDMSDSHNLIERIKLYFCSLRMRIAASKIAVSSNVTTPPSGPCSI